MNLFKLLAPDGRTIITGSHLACLRLLSELELWDTPITSEIRGTVWPLYGWFMAFRIKRLNLLNAGGVEKITMNRGVTYTIEKNF